MKTMMYKGYAAFVEFDAEDRLLVGHIAGLRDVVGFHATTVDELESAFHEAVDDYLAACEKLGQPPNKPYSGRLMLRIPPEVHAHAAMMAQAHGVSQLVSRVRTAHRSDAAHRAVGNHSAIGGTFEHIGTIIHREWCAVRTLHGCKPNDERTAPKPQEGSPCFT